jgi:hypothetical protein
MSTVFGKSAFTKNTLSTTDGLNSIICWLKSENGDRFSPDLLRNQSNGFVSGYLVQPAFKPQWLIPGIVLRGVINQDFIEYIFTVEPSINISIPKARKKLGDPIRFSWILATEYRDRNNV